MTREDFEVLAKLKSLEWLVLEQAIFDDEAFAAMKGHPNLKRIQIKRSQLTERSAEVFKSFPKLER